MLRIAGLLAALFALAAALLALNEEDVAAYLAGGPEAVPTGDMLAGQLPVAPMAPREVSVKTGLYSFDYSYPAMAAAVPELAALLDERIEQARAKLEAEAQESRKDAKANGYPFQPHYYDAAWDVSADLPGWLAMSAAIQTYGGGAHPNHDFDSLVWDRTAARLLAPLDLFVSAEALDEAVHGRYCAALDRERAERREQTIAQVRADEMWKCPSVSELVIVLQSQAGKGFDRLLLLAAPYVAGAYAEGSYEHELPVDAAVLAAVKPEFRGAFRAAS
jgi:hypothetical protein